MGQGSPNKVAAPLFIFYFTPNAQLSKVRLEQDRLGSLDFTAMHAVTERKV
jgi:hypothetical protein